MTTHFIGGMPRYIAYGCMVLKAAVEALLYNHTETLVPFYEHWTTAILPKQYS